VKIYIHENCTRFESSILCILDHQFPDQILPFLISLGVDALGWVVAGAYQVLNTVASDKHCPPPTKPACSLGLPICLVVFKYGWPIKTLSQCRNFNNVIGVFQELPHGAFILQGHFPHDFEAAFHILGDIKKLPGYFRILQ
jgi:hypothetical protein